MTVSDFTRSGIRSKSYLNSKRKHNYVRCTARCTAVTLKGTKCKRKCKHGNSMCYQHRMKKIVIEANNMKLEIKLIELDLISKIEKLRKLEFELNSFIKIVDCSKSSSDESVDESEESVDESEESVDESEESVDEIEDEIEEIIKNNSYFCVNILMWGFIIFMMVFLYFPELLISPVYPMSPLYQNETLVLLDY